MDQYLKDESADAALVKLQEMTRYIAPFYSSKFKFMEMHLSQRRMGLLDKLPDLRTNIEVINFLASEDNVTVDFELNDTLFAGAAIHNEGKISLWLGANVMLEYTFDEAKSLLQKKLVASEEQMTACEEDLQFLKEQITTIEVNMARIYNWEVKRKSAQNKA